MAVYVPFSSFFNFLTLIIEACTETANLGDTSRFTNVSSCLASCWYFIGLFPCALYMVVCFSSVLTIFIVTLPTYILWPHIVIVSFATLFPVAFGLGYVEGHDLEAREIRMFSYAMRLSFSLLQFIAVMGLLGWALYRTGSYSTIHDLFWNSWSLPPWNVHFLKMHILDWFQDLAFIRVLNFALPIREILGASVGIQLFTLIGCALPRRIIKCIIAFKSKSQEVTTQEMPKVSVVP